MDLPKALYLSVFSVYILFFGLFLRFYIWKRYSERNFWSQRPTLSPQSVQETAEKMGKPLPFISILVPARNEADVIGNTVRHLQKLGYPKGSFEIIVVTDEKEALSAQKERESLISEVKTILLNPDSQSYPKGLQPNLLTEVSSQGKEVLEFIESQWGSKEAFLKSLSSKAAHTNGTDLFQGKSHDSLHDALKEILVHLYPTTQEVLEGLVREAQNSREGQDIEDTEESRRSFGSLGLSRDPVLKHVVVPYDFDGDFKGRLTGRSVQSTKGRALNWGLRYLDPRSQICGFYDAESRPEDDVLLYIAYRSLIDPANSRIFQGPVFQVRNFYKMTPFCRIAGLYQAVSHEWYLPWLFKMLPFVGGTNVFVQRHLLEQIGGWDRSVLTEDLEFGVRTYLEKGAWPSYLPYHSTEQTPPSFKGFFRQRLRWATGHLQVVDKVRDWRFVPEDRRQEMLYRLSIKGQVEWIIYQLATFVPIITMVLNYNHLLDETVVPPLGRWTLFGFSLVYLSFTFYIYLRYRHLFDESFRPKGFLGNIGVILGLFFLPLAAFLFPLPYTWSLVLKTFGREPTVWVKTPRTRERPV